MNYNFKYKDGRNYQDTIKIIENFQVTVAGNTVLLMIMGDQKLLSLQLNREEAVSIAHSLMSASVSSDFIKFEARVVGGRER